MDNKELLLYHPEIAIKHTLKHTEYKPVRLFGVLFPLWAIETSAYQEKMPAYALLDHYLERAIGEGDLHTITELARFFGLKTVSVEKALHVLEAIQHVSCQQHRWVLTERGWQSLQAGKKQVQYTKKQLFYFECFSRRPLETPHYNEMRVITAADFEDISSSFKIFCHFYPLHTANAWEEKALEQLMQEDRARYNVPDESCQLKCEGATPVYLPMYIVEVKRCERRVAGSYYLAYTHIAERRDAFFEQIINNTPMVRRAIQAVPRVEYVQKLWDDWLAELGFIHLHPEQDAHGLWKIVLPPSAFTGPNERISVAKIGDYNIRKGYFLQIWCEDEATRQRAVLARVLRIVQRKNYKISRDFIREKLQQQSEELQVKPLSLEQFAAYVRKSKDRAIP